MDAQILELSGFFLAVIAVGLIVGACALVATWLALLVAGVFCMFGAFLLVYLANAKAQARRANQPVRAVA